MSVGDFYRTESDLLLFLSHYHRKMLKSFQIVFAGVGECPPWCSIVGATVTVHQFFCILHCMFISILNVLYYIDMKFKPPPLHQIWLPPSIELIFQRERNCTKYIS